MIDVVTDVIRLIKNKQYYEAQKEIDEQYEKFCRTEVSARRDKVDSLNKSIVQLDITIAKIKKQYSIIRELATDSVMSSLDRYLLKLEKSKQELVEQKRIIASNKRL